MSMNRPDQEASLGKVPPELSLLAPDMPEILESFVNYRFFSVATSADGSSCKIARLGEIGPTDGDGYRVLEETDLSAKDAAAAETWITNAGQNLRGATQTQFHQLNAAGGVIKGALHEIKRVRGLQEQS